MTSIAYRGDVLFVEDVSSVELVASCATPFYCYTSERLKDNYKSFAAAFEGMDASIHYAIKANANQAVIRTLASCGAGADIVSGGEMQRALAAGILPKKIVFSGVAKTKTEITEALKAGIGQINVESLPELRRVAQIAQALQKKAPVALRINPDIQAGGNAKIATGHKEAKFGIGLDQLAEALGVILESDFIDFQGFAVHLGSHINDYAPYRRMFAGLAQLTRTVREAGFEVKRLDLGGGIAIPYDGETETTLFSDYADLVRETLGDLGCSLAFEPGRRLVGDAGLLLARVEYIKETPAKRFVVIDAAMNDLVRPAMYGARHTIVPLVRKPNEPMKKATVVGGVCETADSFGDDFDLPESLREGDYVAILQAGAYGSVMASTYNARPLVAEVMVRGSAYTLIRKPVIVAEQMRWEFLPTWLQNA